MPRGRCHFSLLNALHERFRLEYPNVAALADRFLADFIAGSVAPDGLRYIGGKSKLDTHFYTEDRPDTWGHAVARMFQAHPDLADPNQLSEQNQVLILGYISHLTGDEAFRDVVTYQVHGIEEWRPTVRGLWSLVDEFSIKYEELALQLDRFNRQDCIGFIDCGMIRNYLREIRPWAVETDPWVIEKVFLELIGSKLEKIQAQKIWKENLKLASDFLDVERCEKFVDRAVQMSLEETVKYLEKGYC